jgi:hypothetical protein
LGKIINSKVEIVKKIKPITRAVISPEGRLLGIKINRTSDIEIINQKSKNRSKKIKMTPLVNGIL